MTIETLLTCYYPSYPFIAVIKEDKKANTIWWNLVSKFDRERVLLDTVVKEINFLTTRDEVFNAVKNDLLNTDFNVLLKAAIAGDLEDELPSKKAPYAVPVIVVPNDCAFYCVSYNDYESDSNTVVYGKKVEDWKAFVDEVVVKVLTKANDKGKTLYASCVKDLVTEELIDMGYVKYYEPSKETYRISIGDYGIACGQSKWDEEIHRKVDYMKEEGHSEKFIEAFKRNELLHAENERKFYEDYNKRREKDHEEESRN